MLHKYFYFWHNRQKYRYIHAHIHLNLNQPGQKYKIFSPPENHGKTILQSVVLSTIFLFKFIFYIFSKKNRNGHKSQKSTPKSENILSMMTLHWKWRHNHKIPFFNHLSSCNSPPFLVLSLENPGAKKKSPRETRSIKSIVVATKKNIIINFSLSL